MGEDAYGEVWVFEKSGFEQQALGLSYSWKSLIAGYELLRRELEWNAGMARWLGSRLTLDQQMCG